MSLPIAPPIPFREAVLQEELQLRGEHARSFEFEGGLRDRSRAIVCIAGMGANGRSFARQRTLSRDRYVLMLNTPPATPPGVDPLIFAADSVEEFLDAERLERPVLMGSSFGGAVAMTVAMRRAERLGGMILANPVLARSMIPLASPMFLDVLEAPRPLANFFAPMAVEIMGGFSLDRDGRNEIVREARNFTLAELRRRLEGLLELDLIPAAQRLKLPLLWIHGGRDLLVPWRRARKTAKAIGAREFLLIKHAGHLPHLSHAAVFNNAVGDFLEQLDRAR